MDWLGVIAQLSRSKAVSAYAVNDAVFMQGSPADSVHFILHGKVKLAVASHDGKEAIVATLGQNEFFGEGCLAGQVSRMATAVAVSGCSIARVEKAVLARRLHDEPGLSEMFMSHLLTRIIRYEADLVDQMFNSSEKRLARILLLLSHFGKDSKTETVVAGINQEHLAQMVGTTRSRINFFMNRFRKLGFVTYDSNEALVVHRGLRTVVLNE